MIPGLTPVHNDSIWLPGGETRNIAQSQAARAVTEYDADLVLGQSRDNNEWVVFVKNGPGGNPFPVLGLGFELPSPERIKEKLYKADTKRHGGKIVAKVEAANAAARAVSRKAADDATGQLVEAFDYGLRAKGVHPFPRIFVPSKKG